MGSWEFNGGSMKVRGRYVGRWGAEVLEQCWKKPNKTNAAAVGSKQANMTTRVFED
jgi:hypothetical protein